MYQTIKQQGNPMSDKKKALSKSEFAKVIAEQESDNLNCLFESKLRSIPMEFAKAAVSEPEDQANIEFPAWSSKPLLKKIMLRLGSEN